MVDTIKVSAKSRSTAVAGAIAGVIREHKHAEVQAIGAGAVNQAIKAIAIARGYLERDGLDIACTPTFVEVDVTNLHWSWGSGAQSILTSRIDGSNLDDKQKRMLKESLQKTACGLSSVVLTPGAPAQAQSSGSQEKQR